VSYPAKKLREGRVTNLVDKLGLQKVASHDAFNAFSNMVLQVWDCPGL
jgi:hypothetical protein